MRVKRKMRKLLLVQLWELEHLWLLFIMLRRKLKNNLYKTISTGQSPRFDFSIFRKEPFMEVILQEEQVNEIQSLISHLIEDEIEKFREDGGIKSPC